MDEKYLKITQNDLKEAKSYVKKVLKDSPENYSKVLFKCSECGKESNISIKYFLKKEELICRECKQKKSLKAHIEAHKDEWVGRWKKAIKDKYGVENVAFSESISEKKKATCLEKYGTEYAIQSKQVRDKIEDVFNEKYGGKTPFKSSTIQEKCQASQKIKNNGKLSSQTEECRQKIRDTCTERYGVPYGGHTQEAHAKRKATCMEKYGVEEYAQSDAFRQKRKEIMLKKYGVEFSMQDPEKRKDMMEKLYIDTGRKNPKQKGYVYEGIHFDSSYELAFYIYHKDNNKNIECHPIDKSISYTDAVGKTHTYFPDFLVDDRVIEIKGNQFFNEKGEPWNPYSKKYWWDKYNCLLNNGVQILKKDDKELQEAITYVNHRYGRKFLKECRNKK